MAAIERLRQTSTPTRRIRQLCKRIIHSFWLGLIFIALHIDAEAAAAAAESAGNSSGQLLTWFQNSRIDPIIGLCLVAAPDGIALLPDSQSNKELLLVFKSSAFWIVPAEFIVELADNGRINKFNISEDNQLESKKFWDSFPDTVDYVTSFTGLDSKDPFHNNVLVLSQTLLLRYKVQQLSASSNNISVSLISSHQTEYWFRLPAVADINYMVILRQTRILAVSINKFWGPSEFGYILNPENLDNPVQREFQNFKLEHDKKLRFQYRLADKSTISMLTSGNICHNNKCKRFMSAINCKPQIEGFVNGFASWIYRDSIISLRLAMISLSSIMLVNFAFALSFIYNQLKRIYDLT